MTKNLYHLFCLSVYASLYIQPIYEDNNSLSLPDEMSLDNWSEYASLEQGLIKKISVGGLPVSEFRSGNTQYAIASNVGVVSASAISGVTLNITQATKESPIAYINAQKDGLSVTYCVSFSGNAYTLSKITSPSEFVTGKNSCSVTVDNTGDTTIYPTLFVATYKDGELTGLKTNTKRINYDVYKSLKDTLSAEINVSDSDTEIKIFLWDHMNNPYSKFEKIDIRR